MDSLQTINADLSQVLSMARAQRSQFSRTKLPQLVAEYKEVFKAVHLEPNIKEGDVLSDVFQSMTNTNQAIYIPAGAKLLTKLHHDEGGSHNNDVNFVRCSWGIQWSEDEFIKAAVDLEHPKSFLKTLPPELEGVVDSISQMGNADLMLQRVQWLKRWIFKANEIKNDKTKLHNNFDESVRRVVASKRILLFREMLEDAGYYDPKVCDILLEGVPMVGEVEESGHFPKHFKPAMISTSMLEERSKDINGAIISSTRSSGDVECDRFVYEETMKEVDRGWLEGPFPIFELEEGSSISRRFGLWQKTKYRCIDDFSGSLVNATCSVSESPFIHTIYISCAMLDRWMRNLCHQERSVSIVGRSFDLKAAYRQLYIKPCHRKHSYISVFNPSTSGVEIYRGVALPFGSIQSVYNFLRLSHAIWFLGATKLLSPWSFYYDDFLCCNDEYLAKHTEECILLFFKLIGWRIAEDGAKAETFSNRFNCLRVTFDLSETLNFRLSVANVSSRVEELTREIEHVLSTRKLKKSAANKLRGRMQFAENQIFGRLSRRCLKAISEHAVVGQDDIAFQAATLLREFVNALSSNRPRSVDAFACETWFIFTDAFYESDSHPCSGVGGVLISPSGKVLEFFSEALSNDLAVSMGHGSKGTIILKLNCWQCGLPSNCGRNFSPTLIL